MENELRHYGVLGMKWGVRRGRTKEAYAKAGKKIEKFDAKLAKQDKKISKHVEKYNKAKYGWGDYKTREKRVAKAEFKVQRAQYKKEKTLRKGVKWVQKMEQTFADTNVKVSAAHKAKGKQYAEELRKREEFRVNKLY